MKRIVIVLATVLTLASCGKRECKNTNPVFEKNAPDSKEYKKELAKLLKSADHSDLRYWFERYEEKNQQGYMYVKIQGDDICATGIITVQNWTGIENIQKSMGKGYSGAELANLGIEVYQDSSNIEFFYTGVDKIID